MCGEGRGGVGAKESFLRCGNSHHVCCTFTQQANFENANRKKFHTEGAHGLERGQERMGRP